MSDETPKSPAEILTDSISADVERVVGHLQKNRTTETEAKTLRDAASRSLVDHAAAKSLNRSG